MEKSVEGVVMLLLSLNLVGGKQQFTQNFAHEEVVDTDVVGWLVQVVLDADQFELSPHTFAIVKDVKGFQ